MKIFRCLKSTVLESYSQSKEKRSLPNNSILISQQLPSLEICWDIYSSNSFCIDYEGKWIPVTGERVVLTVSWARKLEFVMKTVLAADISVLLGYAILHV